MIKLVGWTVSILFILATFCLVIAGNVISGICLLGSLIVLTPSFGEYFEKIYDEKRKEGAAALIPRGTPFLLFLLLFGISIWTGLPNKESVSTNAPIGAVNGQKAVQRPKLYILNEREKSLLRNAIADDIDTLAEGGKAGFPEVITKMIGDYTITTSAKLQREYEKNEVAADDKFRNKTVFITGTVLSIDRSIGESYFIGLNGGDNMFINPRAQMADGYKSFVVRLEKGNAVSMACKGDGMLIGAATLTDCEPIINYAYKKAQRFVQEFDIADALSKKDSNRVYIAVFGIALSDSLPADSVCFTEFAVEKCGIEMKRFSKDKAKAALFQTALATALEKIGINKDDGLKMGN